MNYRSALQKKLTFAVLVGVIALAIVCDGSSIAGKYIQKKKPSQFIELRSNCTFLIQDNEGSTEGTYERKGNQLKATVNGRTGIIKIDGYILTDPDGDQYIMQ